MLVNSEDIFQRERFEIEAITGVVIRGDSFRIAVDHDRLIAVIAKRKGSVAAAVIKLNSLPDTIRPTSQDNDFFLFSRSRLVFVFVRGIEIWRVALEFRSAGVHAFVNRHDATFLA